MKLSPARPIKSDLRLLRHLGAATCLVIIPSLPWAQQQEPDVESTVVVSARRTEVDKRMPTTPVQTLSGDELALRSKGTLGETLAGLPGIHLDNFGGGASRPVIRGQTLPRIDILSDGARMFDASSVSPDHAITTDPLLLDSIEIVRGPAAVIYGGNAATGAVNLIDGKIPKVLPGRALSGSAEARYGTGDREKTVVGRVTAAVAGQFAIHAEGSDHRAGDYKVPASYGSKRLKDSYADNDTYAFGVSWITGKGYLGAAYTRQRADYGLPGHRHSNAVCHNHQEQLHCAA